MTTWAGTAQESPVQQPGNVVTTVLLTNGGTSQKVRQDYRYDGTLVNLNAVVKASLPSLDSATSKPIVVASGTVLDLSTPAPVSPVPPTQDQIDREAYFAAKRQVQTLNSLVLLKRKEVTQQMVDDATSAWNALVFDPVWEGLA